MKYKKNDRREKALARHVERVIRAERVSAVREMKKQTRRIIDAVGGMEGSLDALGAELLRHREAGSHLE